LLLQLLDNNESEYADVSSYTFTDLTRDLNIFVLPERWCFIKLPHQVVFYHNQNTKTTTVIVDIAMNFSVRIIFLKTFYIHILVKN